MSDLHQRIMNMSMPTTAPNSSAYRLGHREARHAAAEMVLAAADRIEALEAEVERLRADVRIVVTNIGGPRDPTNNAGWWAAVDRLRAPGGEE